MEYNIIKYANRKLYIKAPRPKNEMYLNIKDIFPLVKNGHKIKVVDYETQEDITEYILKLVVKHGSFSSEELHKFIKGSK